MKPYFELALIGEVHTNSALMLLGFLASLLIFWFFLATEIKSHALSVFGLFGLIIGTSLAAFLGARLFHVLIERPHYFLERPELILTQFDGMTFYGALAAGVIFVFFFLRRSGWAKSAQAKIWDAGAIATSLSIGLMRLGCFANGCCWGKISGLPWAVQYYNERSVMPYKGIPVHPVQVYDAALGFAIGVILWILWKENLARGRLFLIFCLLYPITRFATEFFRADSFRGEDILFGLSTSQLISLVLFVVSATLFWKSQHTPRPDY